MNEFRLAGVVVASKGVRATSHGLLTLEFSLEQAREDYEGEPLEKPALYDVVLVGEAVREAERFVKLGMYVEVEGRISQFVWEDPGKPGAGKLRRRTFFVATKARSLVAGVGAA